MNAWAAIIIRRFNFGCRVTFIPEVAAETGPREWRKKMNKAVKCRYAPFVERWMAILLLPTADDDSRAPHAADR